VTQRVQYASPSGERRHACHDDTASGAEAYTGVNWGAGRVNCIGRAPVGSGRDREGSCGRQRVHANAHVAHCSPSLSADVLEMSMQEDHPCSTDLSDAP